jgi:putative ABC transport system permease protein
MLFNFLKIAFRNIRRHKLFSAINIISLTLSITICLAVLLLIKNQIDFDTSHPHQDRTYRLITEATYDNGATQRYATAPLPLADLLKQNYPFVEKALQIQGRNIHYSVLANGKKLDASAAYSQPEFFDLFGFTLKRGNAATALSNPNSVIITPETAQRFFGDKNPMGETFKLSESKTFTVTGVLDSNLEKTHLEFDFLASLKILTSQDSSSADNPLQRWDDLNEGRVYVTLSKNAKAGQLHQVLPEISRDVSSNRELASDVKSYSFEAQSLPNISPGEQLRYEMGAGKTRTTLELLTFAGVALVVLLMACFNYTNLSIARALKRSREVGIRRLLGAQRIQIMGQFVIQSTIIASASLIFAYALLPFIPLPADIWSEINNVTPDLELISWLVLFSIFTGLVAGGFPAWMLSSLKPTQVLKNIKSLNLIKGLTLRKTLVTAQFAISIILLVTSLVVYQQSQYAATTDYGFQQENIVNLNLQQEVDPLLMKEQLSQIPGVDQVSGISQPFGYFSSPEDFYLKPKGSPIHGDWFSVDRDLIPNLGLKLIAGTNFTKQMAENPGNHAIINKHFLSVTPWQTPSEAIGKTFYWRDSELQIIGVLEDFKYKTLSLPVRPMILQHQPEWSGYLNIKLAGSDNEKVISEMEKVWEKLAPQLPLQYQFYDQAIYNFQSKEQTVASIAYYALIALSIACLGLLGMVTYTVEVRTQEVGIRKVLGASTGSIMMLLSKEFVWLLGIAAVLGLPAGYWIGQQFLSTYAYHISIGIGTLSLGLAIMLVVGLLAVGTQTWNVAQSNPTNSIRSEA